MSKQVTVQQNRFDGGIGESPRENSSSTFILTKQFDIFTDYKRLIPYRDFEDDSTSQSMAQYLISDFCLSPSLGRFYALGINGSGQTKLFYKTQNAWSSTWTIPASSEGNGARIKGSFIEYKDTLWGFQGTNQIWKGTPGSITNTVASVSTGISTVAQSVIAKDDNMYMFYNNKVARVNASGTVTDVVLTLPTDMRINSCCNYGNYLALGCASTGAYGSGFTKSKVFLWNLTSPDVQETIDWGEGDLKVLDLVDGVLTGITDHFLSSTLANGKPSIIIKQYIGGIALPIVTLPSYYAIDGSVGTPALYSYKAIQNNRLYFLARIVYDYKDSSNYSWASGIFSFGRKDTKSNYALVLDFPQDATNYTSQTFGNAANLFFITKVDGTILKQNDTDSYTLTSVLEPNIHDFNDVYSDKRLENFKISFRKLRTGESVVLKYKVDSDADTAWTTIGTYNTVGGISHTFVREEATPKDFTSGKEFKFRIESTGGAEITGWSATATVLNNV